MLQEAVPGKTGNRPLPARRVFRERRKTRRPRQRVRVLMWCLRAFKGGRIKRFKLKSCVAVFRPENRAFSVASCARVRQTELMENKLEHIYGRSGLVFLQEGAGQATRVAHFYARPAGGAASKAGPLQDQECFMAAGESFRGQERKTDGCQTGNRRAPAEGVGIRKRLWQRYGRNDRGWGQGGRERGRGVFTQKAYQL